MKKNVTLKANSFKYPTKEERIQFNKKVPKINRLNFEYKSAFFQIINRSPFDDAVRNEDIYWWNQCLNNRIGKLTQSYIYTLTHYERFKGDLTKKTDEILFDYYLEIFYYYFFSTRDVLAQLLNLIFNLKVSENRLYFNKKFAEKIPHKKIQGYLVDFIDKTGHSVGIRNSFNHRFTPNQPDNRAWTNITKKERTIGFNNAKEIDLEQFISDIENLMDHFAELMNRLDKEIRFEQA